LECLILVRDSFIYNFPKMKVFFKILLSILLAVSCLILLEQFVYFGLKNNRNFKLSYIQKKPINADLLVHGPCEAEWTIDPTILEKILHVNVYNLALNHSDFADNYLFLLEYLKNQKKPKAILLYVTPESFDSLTANTFNSYRFSFLLKQNRKEISKVIKESDKAYWKVIDIPFLKYSYYSNFIYYKAFSGWIDYLTNRKVSSWPNGYVAPLHSYNAAFKSFRDLNPKEGTFLWSKLREKYFIEIIKYAKEQNIALLIYESPVYYEALAYQKNRKEHINRIDSICDVYKVPYFRFDTLSMQFNKNNYFSTYNTTISGNKIFNQILGKFLKDTMYSIIEKQSKFK
jgi:hypothetical protein